jgi:hypothetical protein
MVEKEQQTNLSLLKIPYNSRRNHTGKQIEDSISSRLC